MNIEELNEAVHKACGYRGEKIPDYCGSIPDSMRALHRLSKKHRLFSGCYFGDLSHAQKKDGGWDCLLFRDMTYHKRARVVVAVRGETTLSLAIVRAIVELDAKRRAADVW